MTCQKCAAHRSRLYRCVTCGVRACGCCLFKSKYGGRFCCTNENDRACGEAYIAKMRQEQPHG